MRTETQLLIAREVTKWVAMVSLSAVGIAIAVILR